MKIEELLQALTDAIISEECTSFGAEQVIINAIKKKYGLEGLYISKYKEVGESYWFCTTDPAYQWQGPAIRVLEVFLMALKDGEQQITFLDTNVEYNNLEDLRKDILILGLANV